MDNLVLPGKKPMEVTTQHIKGALGLLEEGIIETKKSYIVVEAALGILEESIIEVEKSYIVVEEISKKRSMHQVKDVPDFERRAEF